MSERGGSNIQRLRNWISKSTQNRLKMALFKFRVVQCRIRLFPTLTSKIKWLGSELPLIRVVFRLKDCMFPSVKNVSNFVFWLKIIKIAISLTLTKYSFMSFYYLSMIQVVIHNVWLIRDWEKGWDSLMNISVFFFVDDDTVLNKMKSMGTAF